MGYRDENQALRARVAELEGRLEAAESKLKRPQPYGARPLTAWDRALGGPSAFVAERQLRGPLTDTTVDAMLEAATARLDATGTVNRFGKRLVWAGQLDDARRLELVWLEGSERTTFRIKERNNLRGVYFGAIGGGVGGGMSYGAMLAIVRLGVHPGVGVVAWLAAVFVLVRSLYARKARQRQREIDSIADTIETAWNEIARTEASRTRIAPSSTSEEAEYEEEAEHEAEADTTNAHASST